MFMWVVNGQIYIGLDKLHPPQKKPPKKEEEEDNNDDPIPAEG